MQPQIIKQAILGMALLILGATGLVSTAVAGGDHYYQSHSSHGDYARKHHKRYHRKHHHSDGYYRKRQSSRYHRKHHQHRYHRDDRYDYHYDKHGRPYYQHGNRQYQRDYHREHKRRLNDNRRHNHDYDDKYSKPVKPHRPRKQCVAYSVKAIGGMGGFRFQHNIKDFKRLDKNGYLGKVCGRQHVEFELSKVNPAVKVVLKINGKRFVYGAHSGHDRHINNWHRKYYSLSLDLDDYHD